MVTTVPPETVTETETSQATVTVEGADVGGKVKPARTLIVLLMGASFVALYMP